MEEEIIFVSSGSDSENELEIGVVEEEVEMVRDEVPESRSEKKENSNPKKKTEKRSKSSEIPIGKAKDTKEKTKKKAEAVKSPEKKTDSKKDDEKRKSKKVEEKNEDAEEEEVQNVNESTALYQFPMNRISRIIKSENSDIRMFSEAVFLINKASEKFLELFSKEAYACASEDRKKRIEYKHLSSVIPKRRRLDFLSDIVPPRVTVADALIETPSAET